MDDYRPTELERELEWLLHDEPSPELRGRVARIVGRELGRQRPRDWFVYAGAAAAMLVLWANLSWTLSRQTSFVERPRVQHAKIAAQLRQLLPDLTEAEARRQAVLLGGSRLPDPHARRALSLGLTSF